MNTDLLNIDLELEEVYALICAVSTALSNNGEVSLAPEAAALALNGIASQLRSVIETTKPRN